MDDSRITIKEVAGDVGKSFGLCQAICTDVLGMKRASAKIVPKLIILKPKQHRVDIAQKMLTTLNDPDLLKKVITGEESWIETKAH